MQHTGEPASGRDAAILARGRRGRPAGDEGGASAPPSSWAPDGPPAFDDPMLLEKLEAASLADLDGLPFGLITMDRRGMVVGYNANESARSGLSPSVVLGRDMFVVVAPCVNNYLVAERYWSSEALDEQLDYVFTFRMRPTPVRLRLMAVSGSDRQYLAVRDR